MCRLPQPLPPAEPITEPRDIPYPGVVQLKVDVTDIERRIFKVVETIPVQSPGELTLLYPQWLPGYHSPQAPIELLAGLKISAAGAEVPWRRHPTEISAFHITVPPGVSEIDVVFQFLSPTDSSQGQVVVGADLLCLQWNAVVLYPAGYFARRITVQPTLRVPPDWQLACALEQAENGGGLVSFPPTPLDVLVDSPVIAGKYFRRIELEASGNVRLNIVADEPQLLDASDGQIEPHRELVRQADLLFGSRHFDHFDVLMALSDQIDSNGVEHHRSCEAMSIPGYFTEWDTKFARRDTIPHEYVHSWNGKYRRGADSWSPCFHQPIRNSLMWVYEGQTQYWDRVLSARSGLWTKDWALQALAEIAATQEARAGSRWRPLRDTTRDPIIAARSPLPWPSWQRSEDYYTEGALVWLDVDTRIRALTDEKRSLDDFAREFFGQEDGVWTTSTYVFDDVVSTLERLAPFEWREFFEVKLAQTGGGAPLDGLARGGYRLVFRDEPTPYAVSKEAVFGTTNLLFSIGLSVAADGEINEVLWNSPAFEAALTKGARIRRVNGKDYSTEELKGAIASARSGKPTELVVAIGKRERAVSVCYSAGHRYPDLEPIDGTRRRLDEILEPLSSSAA